MYYTYILESLSDPLKRYIGHTSDLHQRLTAHNAGKCPHSSKHRPWKIKCFFAFETRPLAQRFERYLKSGPGHAFAARHFFHS